MTTGEVDFLGLVAFVFRIGHHPAKIMNLFLTTKINPLDGSAGFALAAARRARLRTMVANLDDPSNYLMIYLVHAITRKSLGDMTRKLSVTESHRFAQLRGTVSRRKSRVASANWVHVA